MRTLTKDLIEDKERAFYASKSQDFENIKIEGPVDGESAFKECNDIKVNKSLFALRYPFWHNTNTTIENCIFKDTARAGLWYGNHLTIIKCNYSGIKAVRECHDVHIEDSSFVSDEFGWKSSSISIKNSSISSAYAFLESKDINLDHVNFKGKYSFQYVRNLTINDSSFDTKDAFWHANNVVVKNSYFKGEYIAWYSENITFINCTFEGTQPFCYCKGIKLIDCKFNKCDLAFEYSEIEGNIIGGIDSIKNPLSGTLLIDEKPLLIVDENDRSHGQFSLKVSQK